MSKYLAERYEYYKKEVEQVRAEYRNYQMSHADGASQYAETYFKTLYIFIAGAFITLPSYAEFVIEDKTISVLIPSLVLFISSAFFLFLSNLSAYFSSSFYALEERERGSALENFYWSLYYFASENKDEENACLNRKKDEEKKAKEYSQKAIDFEHSAVCFAILALFLFFTGLIKGVISVS